MRYGRLKVGVGPGGGALGVAALPPVAGDADVGLGGGVAPVNGGGSIDECEVGALDGIAGSGNAGMTSPAFESMVNCFVGVVVERKV
jgi:hypothetical protein